MTFDPYAEFIKAVTADDAIFNGRKCRISSSALERTGEVIETYSFAVASTYLLDRASQAKHKNREEQEAFRRLHFHLQQAAIRGLESSQIAFLVRKLEVFPEVEELL